MLENIPPTGSGKVDEMPDLELFEVIFGDSDLSRASERMLVVLTLGNPQFHLKVRPKHNTVAVGFFFFFFLLFFCFWCVLERERERESQGKNWIPYLLCV